MRTISFILLMILSGSMLTAQERPEASTTVEKQAARSEILLQAEKGKQHNHPLYAIWLADSCGRYIQTLFVSESIGKGVFKRGSRRTGRWMPGEIARPASLPYWIHQRNVTNEKGTLLPTTQSPVADAYTGATPKNSFKKRLQSDQPLRGKYRIYLEVNQSWDWNEYWTNNRYPGNKEYMTSSQPALVYMAEIDSDHPGLSVPLTPIGHSHYAGENGKLFTDLSTITTALDILKEVSVSIR
ncbi:MAG TPA: hypothetical protein PLH60_07770 [Proteiniphilum sp.]|nr:hypothetical protein [Proteiniphilum sp.]HPD87685.1 hypothetical protein [Proteiniphilum sp.]HPJ49468.1 hypothetical protein [Proteiniphilum sp.]HPR20435.1 hypothetical protein [Proteiniphilum sp.]